MTAGETLAQTIRLLRENGVPEAEASAEFLLAAALGVSRGALQREFETALSPDAERRLREFVARRGNREPLAYILGSQPFHSLDLKVDPRVLIPRPETEEWIARAIESLGECAPFRFADIGTGSGCLAIQIAKHCPRGIGQAIDCSEDALALARENATAAGVGERISFKQGNLLEPLEGEFELIVSNPPYIPSAEIETLEPEVLKEPRLALDGGEDGLGLIRAIVQEAPKRLSPGGSLWVEFAQGQGDRVVSLMERAGLVDVRLDTDLSGTERVSVGKMVS